jgi:hypothetical protein
MQQDECETCGGEQVVVGDRVDGRGERTDDVQPCPDCVDGDDHPYYDTLDEARDYREARDLWGAL